MHLFVVHQFPDYDNFVPIVINLKKKNRIEFFNYKYFSGS